MKEANILRESKLVDSQYVPFEYPSDCDLILKVTGSDPYYILINGQEDNQELLQFTPDSEGYIRITFETPVKSIRALLDWTSVLWKEYNLNLPSNYGDRLISIAGIGKLLKKYKLDYINGPFWKNNNAVLLENPEYWDVSSVTRMRSPMSFSQLPYLKKWDTIDLSRWDTSRCWALQFLFQYSNASEIIAPNIVTNIAEDISGILSGSVVEEFDATGWDTTFVVNMGNFASGCKNLKRIKVGPKWSTSHNTIFENMFNNCNSLKEVPPLDTSNALKINNLFTKCYSIERIQSPIDVAKATWVWAIFDNCPRLKYAVIKNIGKITPDPDYYFNASSWGSDSEENRQSLVDSLLTYSNDRVAAGMPAQKVTIGSACLKRLTQEEIAAITAKGYTLS